MTKQNHISSQKFHQHTTRHFATVSEVNAKVGRGIIQVTVESAGFNGGNNATIQLNGIPVDIAENENGHHRGLNIVVVDEITGKVKRAQAYDTYESFDKFEEFIEEAKYFPDGTIVAAACKDDCITKMNLPGKQFFWGLGS